MNQNDTNHVTTRATLALTLIAALAGAGRASAACQGGRFLVHGEALIAAETEPDAIVVNGASVAISSGCRPVAAKVRAVHGHTIVRAYWLSCADPRRKVTFRAEIDESCHMTGTLTLKHPRSRRSFVASASTCGDGLVDADAGEACDDGNQAPGDGCEADCTPTPPPPPPPTTTTTTTPSRHSTTSTTLVVTDRPPSGSPGDAPPSGPPGDEPPPLPF